jgi:hypothetical protein
MNFAAYSFNPNDHERSSVMVNFAAKSNSRSTCQFSAFMTMLRAIIVAAFQLTLRSVPRDKVCFS